MRVEVAYAKPEKQWILPIDVAAGATVADAISASGIMARCPELELATVHTGIFGKPCPLHQQLQAGDRVELYRPLLTDPRSARRERVRKR